MNADSRPSRESAHYFAIGTWIEHQHLRGEVIGVDFPARTMPMKVSAVSGHGPRNRLGRTVEVPFDCGTQIARP